MLNNKTQNETNLKTTGITILSTIMLVFVFSVNPVHSQNGDDSLIAGGLNPKETKSSMFPKSFTASKVNYLNSILKQNQNTNLFKFKVDLSSGKNTLMNTDFNRDYVRSFIPGKSKIFTFFKLTISIK